MRGVPVALKAALHCRRRNRAALGGHGNRHGEEGQTAIVVALLLVPLLGLVALALDGGYAYVQRAKAQNAADAAALAGARRMATEGTDAQVLGTVTEYAVTRNKAVSSTAVYLPGGQAVGGGTVPTNGTGVRVTASIPFSTFIAGLLGHPAMTASAIASADAGVVGSPGPSLQPLARRCTQPTITDCFNYGDLYDIYNYGGPGNFGWLSWNGDVNAGYMEDMLRPSHVADYEDPHSVCGAIWVGCWVHGFSGVVNAAGVRTQLDGWVARGNDGTPTGTPTITGTPMVIVIFDTSEGTGSNVNYHIVGFAAFILESYQLPGSQQVWGRFVQWVIPGEVCQSCGDYGVFTVHLTG